jgi:hypothetical protein
MADVEVYTKLEYLADMANVAQLRQELRAMAATPMREREPGFRFQAYWTRIATLEASVKARWGQSARTFDVLRKTKWELDKAMAQPVVDGDDVTRLTRKMNFLKMLCAKILAGVPRDEAPVNAPDAEPALIRAKIPCPDGCKRTNAHVHWATV